jgi:hypothetical protein
VVNEEKDVESRVKRKENQRKRNVRVKEKPVKEKRHAEKGNNLAIIIL